MLASICGSLGLTLADLLSAGSIQLIWLGGPSFGAPSPGGPNRTGIPSGPVLMAVGRAEPAAPMVSSRVTEAA